MLKRWLKLLQNISNTNNIFKHSIRRKIENFLKLSPQNYGNTHGSVGDSVELTYLMVGQYQLLFQWVNGVYQSPSHELKYQGSLVL